VLQPALATRELTVRFGGHVAVDHVTADFFPGTLTAIIGPNGAGKTSYFNLISGQLRAVAGAVILNSRDITRLPPAGRTKHGLARGFQLNSLFPELTVHENVRLAVQARAGRGHDAFRMAAGLAELADRAMVILERVQLGLQASRKAAELPHGDQRKLDVAMLVALDPHVYLLDEPTAGMSLDDTPAIVDLIDALRADRTKTILLVEHKMDVIRTLADRVIAFIDGRIGADGDPAEVMASSIVQRAYLGLAHG
jgi:branched-chain amino acid transport system ATP-binding protein